MLVGEVMTEAVVTAEPSLAVREIDVALCVVADGRDPESRAGDHASTPVIVAAPDMDLEEAADRMIRHGIRRLVVIEAGALVGVVTLDDLASRVGDRASAISARITRPATPDYFSLARAAS